MQIGGKLTKFSWTRPIVKIVPTTEKWGPKHVVDPSTEKSIMHYCYPIERTIEPWITT